MMNNFETRKYSGITDEIIKMGKSLGFSGIGISNIELNEDEKHLFNWLEKGYQADMEYMSGHGTKRTRPSELVPGTIRVITFRFNYLPENTVMKSVLKNKNLGYISRYALGRDYHKVLKKKLKKIEEYIKSEIPSLESRIFADSAPVMERALAAKSGLGWTGKNSLLINSDEGSFFFLGEIYVNIPLPIIGEKEEPQCGNCTACIKMCPTGAIVEPYVIDSNKCISYLTIENKGFIPEELRSKIGNRIYGCDDCQIFCPKNKNVVFTEESDFSAREFLLNKTLLELWSWSEKEFLKNTEGSAIRRIGYERWSRNLAVAIGNSEPEEHTISVLKSKLHKISPLVDEHIIWAINKLQ